MKQTRTGLQLALAAWRAGVTGQDQAGNTGNFPEPALCQFAGIECRHYVFQQMIGTEQTLLQQLGPVKGLWTQKFKAVVVDGDRKCARLLLRGTPGQHRGQPLMYQATRERIAK